MNQSVIPINTIDLYILIDEWLSIVEKEVLSGDKSKTTMTTYKVGIGKFADWIQSGVNVTPTVVLDWKASLIQDGRKPNTANTWLAGVRSFFSWATANGKLPYNPAEFVRGSKRKGSSKKHLKETLTDVEMIRVLSQPDKKTDVGKRDLAIMSLMAYTAARSVEVREANKSDLKTKSGHLVLPIRGKGHSDVDEILVIAHPDAEAALYDWLSVRGEGGDDALFVSMSNRSIGKRLSLRSIREIVKSYFSMAGVSGVTKTTHSLRHTAITSAITHNAPIQKVQSMARHSNISTTMIYYHEADRVENPAENFIKYDDRK